MITYLTTHLTSTKQAKLAKHNNGPELTMMSNLLESINDLNRITCITYNNILKNREHITWQQQQAAQQLCIMYYELCTMHYVLFNAPLWTTSQNFSSLTCKLYTWSCVANQIIGHLPQSTDTYKKTQNRETENVNAVINLMTNSFSTL